MTKTGSGYDDDTGDVYNYSNQYVIVVARDENASGFGWVTASVSYPTQLCNKVRVKYSYTLGVPTFNGVDGIAGSPNTDLYAYLNCSGDTFTLSVNLGNASTDKCNVMIKEVYFYHE